MWAARCFIDEAACRNGFRRKNSPIPRERESVLNADIVSVGDALFRNTPGQTFRVVK